MGALGPQLVPCGPVIDPVAADRLFEPIAAAASEGQWSEVLDAARPALAPVFAASPYLGHLARRSPDRLHRILTGDPAATLAAIIAETEALDGDPDAMKAPLRRLKGDLHLLSALADLGGVWSLDQVTGALSDFADASVHAALRAVAFAARERGRLLADPGGERGPIPGLFGFAMGKHGAHELNYSSDIDLTLFYEPDVLRAALSDSVEPQTFADRSAQGIASLLTERTADGYVFRVDLRLRPDPSSTPPVVAAPAALAYYESVGQNWERAAFIKARAVCGDLIEAREFQKALQPFVWRRSLDYNAVADIHSIKRQIHAFKTGDGLEAAGANLKLGRGGIREIEFYAQTQQLIRGGRDPALRQPRTQDALHALVSAGHVQREAADALDAAYIRLRGLEHRVQMLADEQTHKLPEDDAARRAVAALSGFDDLAAFDASVRDLLLEVNGLYGQLFEDEEELSSPYGSLVFTGVENDPETLETLKRMGFSNPVQIADTIRAWHHGRIPATRTARGRELFTRLAPKLLTALARTGAADAAFTRFSVFFAGLSAGVQVQSLFLAQPELFEMIVGVMAYAPRLARALARNPAALDSILDARFMRDLDEDSGVLAQIEAASRGGDFEDAMNAVRRVHREQMFRIGMQVLSGKAVPGAAGRGYAAIADAIIRTLAVAAMAEVDRQAGVFPGAVAVIALGKAGSREMTAGSDLDLMAVYEASEPGAMSATKGWSADVFYVRFIQRLISALSAHTAEGGLYEVDMRLRPTGSKGPVAVSAAGFADYYKTEAATWEFMALTRARVVWASDPEFAERVEGLLADALSLPRDAADVTREVRAMRDLMDRERPPTGLWDLKLSPGAQVDCEFAGQHRRLLDPQPGEVSTRAMLADPALDPVLLESWAFHQQIAQLLRAAFEDVVDPEGEPEALRQRLAEAVGVADFDALKARMIDLRTRARAAFDKAVPRAATEA